MGETMLDWDDLQLFLAVARGGGLSPAAKLTQRSAATLGRRMHELERTLDKDLFIRHDRGYGLTVEGRNLMEELAQIEARVLKLSRAPSEVVRPLVKISAGTWTTLVLLEKLDEIIGSPPDIRLRFISAEKTMNISHREVVIGFRNRRPVEKALAGRKLNKVEFAPYARPGAPDRWIKVLADTPSARWLDTKITNQSVCEVNAPRNSLDLALAGAGIALLPTFIGDGQDDLQRIGETIPELAHDQWLVTHQDDRYLPEVRRTIDRIYSVLKAGG